VNTEKVRWPTLTELESIRSGRWYGRKLNGDTARRIDELLAQLRGGPWPERFWIDWRAPQRIGPWADAPGFGRWCHALWLLCPATTDGGATSICWCSWIRRPRRNRRGGTDRPQADQPARNPMAPADATRTVVRHDSAPEQLGQTCCTTSGAMASSSTARRTPRAAPARGDGALGARSILNVRHEGRPRASLSRRLHGAGGRPGLVQPPGMIMAGRHPRPAAAPARREALDVAGATYDVIPCGVRPRSLGGTSEPVELLALPARTIRPASRASSNASTSFATSSANAVASASRCSSAATRYSSGRRPASVAYSSLLHGTCPAPRAAPARRPSPPAGSRATGPCARRIHRAQYRPRGGTGSSGAARSAVRVADG